MGTKSAYYWKSWGLTTMPMVSLKSENYDRYHQRDVHLNNRYQYWLLIYLLSHNLSLAVISISDGSQFGSGFCELNPNSKIPAAVDYNGPNGQKIVLFESGSIVLYLAEKYKKFIPSDLKLRAEVMSWMFWQVMIYYLYLIWELFLNLTVKIIYAFYK